MSFGYRIEPEELENIVSAFHYLEGQEYVDKDRLGLGGFCVGASFALIAAADERIRDRVHFVNAFGPYFDMEDLIVQAASRSVAYDGEWIPWDPHELTVRVLTNELVDTMQDPREAELLAWHDGSGPQAKRNKGELSESGNRIARLLEGVTPGEAHALLGELPPEFRQDLARISPSSHISGVKARLLVMHDRHDMVVPAAESRRLV